MPDATPWEPSEDTKLKHYIESDVLTEAKKRIKHTLAVFDKLFVCFSGGKDSLVTLHLVQEVYDELGIKEPIRVIFRDEEVIPPSVVAFVQEYAESGRYDFRYYCIPLKSAKFILGRTFEYVQWSPDRPHTREMPPYAIRLPEGDRRVFDQYTADAFAAQGEKGRLAFLTGIRADESIMRLRASVNKKNENYITATQAANVMLVKPIYDWTQRDVFKYLFERGIRYCPVYDEQILNGDNLRVATPFHHQAAKRLGNLKTCDPAYYDQLMAVFPEMDVQARYWTSLDRKAVFDRYPHTFDGILQYIDAEFDDVGEAEKARKTVKRCQRTRQVNERKGKPMGCYPVLHVFRAVVNGDYKHEIFPKAANQQTKEEAEYEGWSA